ncbi:MAG: hypothetical protein NZ807_12050 [Dehalococcoidia bacterium]|nr:hypothetical protein [Dehalococcoidia bacterium]
MPSFFLAWQYVKNHKCQSLAMVFGIALTLYLPLVTHQLINRFDVSIHERASNTPLIIGAKGSRFDLVLHGLYFRSKVNNPISYADYQDFSEADYGPAVPIYAQFSAKGYPVVGTTVDYFHFRKLRIRQGKTMKLLGDCELGAKVADQLGLAPGDTLMTDRENLFDLAGDYPSKLNITAVLAPSNTADDNAVFVNLKTAWIIAGIGHGHDDQNSTHLSTILVKKHLDFTQKNLGSFHFHGDPKSFPLSAIIAEPQGEKALALTLNHYQQNDRLQALKALKTVQEMMGMVIRVRQFLDANYTLITTAMLVLLGLIITLSRQIRKKEMETMFLLGCSRRAVLALQTTELLILFAAAISLALAMTVITLNLVNEFPRMLTG